MTALAVGAGLEAHLNRLGLIAAMREIAPPGQQTLTADVTRKLYTLTALLLTTVQSQARQEYRRFRAVQGRRLRPDAQRLHEHLAGKVVLVTGGTGCIGSTLIDELARFSPRRLVSLTRGVSRPWPSAAAAEQVQVDVRRARSLTDVFQAVKPDIVYHLAAQHDPGLAEADVRHTLTTNVLGTRNVLSAAAASTVSLVVSASTGKAVRPITGDVYAASKKVGEWLMAEAASRGDVRCSAARFTHVVDNSIIHKRLLGWIATGAPVRLHGTEVRFYVQSALESAQLLLNAGLESEEGVLTVQAIRDLDWPVDLVDMALGAMDWAGELAPIYFSGFGPGYEEHPWPGLYDPRQAGDVSPLINAFEAPVAKPSPACPSVDRFPLELAADPALGQRLSALERALAGDGPERVLRRALDGMSLAMLDARIRALPPSVRERAAARAGIAPRPRLVPHEHRVIEAALRKARDLPVSGAATSG